MQQAVKLAALCLLPAACYMKIHLNGEQRDVPEGVTVAQLLELLEVRMKGVAVERNLDVIPRVAHATTELAEGDRVEVVTLVGGG